MEFWRTILVLLRRKTVVLPVLLSALGLAAATYWATPTKYTSMSTTVLTTSTNGATLIQDPTRPLPQINPLLSLDGMKTAASILIQVLNSRDAENQLGVDKGGATTFTVSDGTAIPQLLGSTGPFIVIKGDSTSPASAREIVVRVAQRLRDELINQQRALNAPPSTFIGMVDVVPPSIPEAQVAMKWQAAIGALVLGLVVGTGVAYFVYRVRGTSPMGSPSADPEAAQRDETSDGPPTIPAVLNSSIGTQSHST